MVSVPEPGFSAWGWRVPFYLSGLLIVVGLLIRLRILETPLFRQLQETNQVAQQPVAETLRRHWREILLAAGRAAQRELRFLPVQRLCHALTAQKVLGVDESVVLVAVNLAAAVEFFTIPIFGILSDYWSRKAVYTCGCLFLILFALPYYALLDTREPVWITVATVIALAGGHAVLYSVQASLIPELFGTRLRYTGASIGYQLAAPFAGGLAPVIAIGLVEAYPGQFWPLALYIIVITVDFAGVRATAGGNVAEGLERGGVTRVAIILLSWSQFWAPCFSRCHHRVHCRPEGSAKAWHPTATFRLTPMLLTPNRARPGFALRFLLGLAHRQSTLASSPGRLRRPPTRGCLSPPWRQAAPRRKASESQDVFAPVAGCPSLRPPQLRVEKQLTRIVSRLAVDVDRAGVIRRQAVVKPERVREPCIRFGEQHQLASCGDGASRLRRVLRRPIRGQRPAKRQSFFTSCRSDASLT